MARMRTHTSFNIALGASAYAAGKGIIHTMHTFGKKEIKLSLFLDDMIVYVKNPEEKRTKSLIKQKREFTRYKVLRGSSAWISHISEHLSGSGNYGL